MAKRMRNAAGDFGNMEAPNSEWRRTRGLGHGACGDQKDGGRGMRVRGALIVAGFGSATCAEGQHAVARALARAFPEREVCCAVLSEALRARLAARGERAEGAAAAIARLRNAGCGDIAVAAALVAPGREYAALCRDAAGLPISAPLLAGEDDCRWLAALLARTAQLEGRTLVAMAHGVRGAGGAAYARLRALLPGEVRIACAVGQFPFGELLPELVRGGVRAVTLMPLTLAAGWHARRQMDGGTDSWRAQLEAQGVDVRVRMAGLGELPEVQARIVAKARAAIWDGKRRGLQ